MTYHVYSFNLRHYVQLKRTNLDGDRTKKGIAISGSLLALSNIVSALGNEIIIDQSLVVRPNVLKILPVRTNKIISVRVNTSVVVNREA